MKKIHIKALAFLLAVSCSLCLVGCSDGKNAIVQSGIEIAEDPPYDQDVIQRAESVLLSLMRYAYRKASSLDDITQTVERRLADYAAEICAVTAKNPVSRDQYIGVIETLEREGTAAIEELLAFRDMTGSSFSHVRSLYLALSGVFGADQVASMLYDVCLVVYDMKYEKAKARFEQYGYPWYKQEADDLIRQKEEFQQSVLRKDFSALIRCATAFAELFFYESDQGSDVFLDAELLMLLQRLDTDEIGIGECGYAILMSLIVSEEAPGRDAPFFAKLRYEYSRNGDNERIVAVMDDAVTLIDGILKQLTVQDIAAVRRRDYRSLAASVFSRFTEDDWTLFERVTGVMLANDAYSALSEAEYGAVYTSYLASLRTVNLHEVREAVGTDGFYECLRDYLIGICPAMAYEVTK